MYSYASIVYLKKHGHKNVILQGLLSKIYPLQLAISWLYLVATMILPATGLTSTLKGRLQLAIS